jgi:hypothetical protein
MLAPRLNTERRYEGGNQESIHQKSKPDVDHATSRGTTQERAYLRRVIWPRQDIIIPSTKNRKPTHLNYNHQLAKSVASLWLVIGIIIRELLTTSDPYMAVVASAACPGPAICIRVDTEWKH